MNNLIEQIKLSYNIMRLNKILKLANIPIKVKKQHFFSSYLIFINKKENKHIYIYNPNKAKDWNMKYADKICEILSPMIAEYIKTMENEQ